jgi:hypothetical protein
VDDSKCIVAYEALSGIWLRVAPHDRTIDGLIHGFWKRDSEELAFGKVRKEVIETWQCIRK